VAASELPGAWVSLDDGDNDLRLFLAYLIAAIQSIFPHVGSETRKYLQAANLPPMSELVSTFINELDRIEDNFILVLDPGLRNKEIASKLFISPKTVKKYTQNIYPKLKASNRRQVAA